MTSPKDSTAGHGSGWLNGFAVLGEILYRKIAGA